MIFFQKSCTISRFNTVGNVPEGTLCVCVCVCVSRGVYMCVCCTDMECRRGVYVCVSGGEYNIYVCELGRGQGV